MAHPKPNLHPAPPYPGRPGHKSGTYEPHGGLTYKALPSMKREVRDNIDLTRPRYTLVAPLLRAPTATYQQLNPAVREGRVVIDWTGQYSTGVVAMRTTQLGLNQRNRNMKKTKGRMVA